jgi:effector-binding domain-containing protein
MKKILAAVGLFILIGAIAYLFIYPYDYIVRFEADAIPGTINQSVKLWHKTEGLPETAVEQEDLQHFSHLLRVGDSVHRYHWEIEPLTDSTSRVIVKIRDRDHSLANKFRVPFGGTAIEAASKKMVRNFAEQLNDHLDLFRVRIDGLSELPGTFYAYVELQTDQHGKAGGMMDHYQLLSDVLFSGGVTLNGPPMIIVDEWNRATDSLKYKFCFPIVRSDRLPEHPDIRYKRIFPNRALKATYNGNYITSDRAWYALLDYAEKHGFEVEPTPVEVFYNNPTLGGDATRWKADIFLPLKEDEGT